MPRQPVDYSKTIIYKIVCKDLQITDVYVGSTTSFKDRKCAHKTDCNNEKSRSYNYKIYKFIRENGGWYNFDMIEIEKYTECKDSNEARTRERYWYEQLNAKLNSQKPQITKEELIEYRKENNKQRYEENKEKYLEECKKYRDEHKEEIYKQNKKWYALNANTPYTCECGWVGNERIKYYHFKKSIKHKNYLENKI